MFTVHRIFFGFFVVVLLPTAEAHTLSTCSFQIWFLNTLMYVTCVHPHQSWCAPPYSLSHAPCFCHSILGVIDVILDVAETTRINLLLSAHMELWCWSQSFTLNLSGDTRCKEEGRSLLGWAQLCDLSSSAASCAYSSSTSQSSDTGKPDCARRRRQFWQTGNRDWCCPDRK